MVALVERRPIRVVASYQGPIEDGFLDEDSLRVQPKAYALPSYDRLAPGEQGLAQPTDGWGADRTLCVHEANRLRPVLRGLSPFYWRLLRRPGTASNRRPWSDSIFVWAFRRP